MEVDIQAQHTEVHPRWRELIQHQLERLNGLGKRFVRVHVTLVHSAHHLRGDEEVRILATLPRDTLRAQKRKATMSDAIHAAFSALERELESREGRRRTL